VFQAALQDDCPLHFNIDAVADYFHIHSIRGFIHRSLYKFAKWVADCAA
jgi:hypothetical protein